MDLKKIIPWLATLALLTFLQIELSAQIRPYQIRSPDEATTGDVDFADRVYFLRTKYDSIASEPRLSYEDTVSLIFYGDSIMPILIGDTIVLDSLIQELEIDEDQIPDLDHYTTSDFNTDFANSIIDDLDNVDISGASNNEVLTYDNGLWINAPASGVDTFYNLTDTVILITPTDSFGIILPSQADTLGFAVPEGEIVFGVDGTAQGASDDGLYWDNSNKRLGVGTSSPVSKTHINTTGTSEHNIFLVEAEGASAAVQWRMKTDLNNRRFLALDGSDNITNQMLFGDTHYEIWGASISFQLLELNNTTGQMTLPFYDNSSTLSGTAVHYLATDASGNVIVDAGTGGASDDLGTSFANGLIVMGDGSPTGKTDADLFYDTSSDQLAIGHGSPNATLDVDGTIRFQDLGGGVAGTAAYLLAVEADGDLITADLDAGDLDLSNIPYDVTIGANDQFHIVTDASTANLFYSGDEYQIGIAMRASDAPTNAGAIAIYSEHNGVFINLASDEIVEFGAGDFEIGGDAIKPGGGDWDAPSDRRMKKNIKTITNPLETLAQLNPVTFNYKKEYQEKNNPNQTYHGYVAQEYQEVFPMDVSTRKNGMLSLAPNAVGPYTVAAIQELYQRVLELERQLANK